MEITIQQRQSGKSSYIAHLMRRDKNSIVIVPNCVMAQRFSEQFKIEPKRVLTITKLVYNQKLKGKTIFIDEVGLCLEALVCGIKLCTHTNDSQELWLRKVLIDERKW